METSTFPAGDTEAHRRSVICGIQTQGLLSSKPRLFPCVPLPWCAVNLVSPDPQVHLSSHLPGPAQCTEPSPSSELGSFSASTPFGLFTSLIAVCVAFFPSGGQDPGGHLSVNTEKTLKGNLEIQGSLREEPSKQRRVSQLSGVAHFLTV